LRQFPDRVFIHTMGRLVCMFAFVSAKSMRLWKRLGAKFKS
jgi:hypothetical protein